MFDRGLVEEVQSLIASGVPPSAKAFQAHGYRRVVEYLQGKRSREDALNQMKLDTRHYAKRQVTWWRAWPGVKWIHRFGDEPEAFTEALHLAEELDALPQQFVALSGLDAYTLTRCQLVEARRHAARMLDLAERIPLPAFGLMATAGMPVSVVSHFINSEISPSAPCTVCCGCSGWTSPKPGSRAIFSLRRGLCFIVQEPSG